jgi:hypothetical protein
VVREHEFAGLTDQDNVAKMKEHCPFMEHKIKLRRLT